MSRTISVCIGPPGTGKTHEVGRWAARAAQKFGVERVMVVSLTRAGAKQAAAIVDLPPQQVGTVHSFAHRALGSPTIAEAKVAEWNETHPLQLLSARSSVGTDDGFHLQDDMTDADERKLVYSRYRTMGVPLEASMRADVIDFAKDWEDWKRAYNYLDFTDLIETALRECDVAPGNPAVILDDEAQDTGKLEMQLLMQWSKSCEYFMLAGDSAQALFRWRGSDPYLLQQLWLDHDKDREPLQNSWRLPRTVYETAYNWAGRFTETMRVSFKPRDAEGTVEHTGFDLEHLTPEGVERLVQEHCQDGRTLMFLTTCGYMLHELTSRLREVGIPFHNPGRPNHGGWNPLPQQRVKGLTIVDRVLAFLRPDRDAYGDEARFWTAQEIKGWVSGLPSTGILARGGQGGFQELKDSATDEEIARAFGQYFLPEAIPHLVPKPDVGWYLGHIKGSDRLRDYVREVLSRRGAEGLRTKPSVIVGTCHSLKGWESDTVILSPDVSMQAYMAARQSQEDAEEMKRVFYVGITRAKSTLLLCRPSCKTFVRW